MHMGDLAADRGFPRHSPFEDGSTLTVMTDVHCYCGPKGNRALKKPHRPKTIIRPVQALTAWGKLRRFP